MIPEFGTNTGRQGTYDVKDPQQQSQALERLKALYAQYGERLQPGYTGETGVSDLGGYSQWQNAVTEAQNISRQMGGKDPLGVKFGGELPTQLTPSIADDPTSSFNVGGAFTPQRQAPINGLRAAADTLYKKQYPGAGR